jgi:HK97 family phage prohead protease
MDRLAQLQRAYKRATGKEGANERTGDGIERRIAKPSATVSPKEAQAAQGRGFFVLIGVAHGYLEQSEIIPGLHERFQVGAFGRAVRRGDDVRFLSQHDPQYVLARTKAKTLELRDTKVGLEFTAELPKNATTGFLVDAIRLQNLSQMSFAFRNPVDTWEPVGRDDALRTVTDVGELSDISLASYPAFPRKTWVTVIDRSGSANGGRSRDQSVHRSDRRVTASSFGGDEATQRWARWVYAGCPPSR